MELSAERQALKSSVRLARRVLARPEDVLRSVISGGVASVVAIGCIYSASPVLRGAGVGITLALLARPFSLWLRPQSGEPYVRPIVWRALALPFKIAVWALAAWYLVVLAPFTEAARNDAFGTEPLSALTEPDAAARGMSRYMTITAQPFWEVVLIALAAIGLVAVVHHSRRMARREFVSAYIDVSSLLLPISVLLAPVLPLVCRAATRVPGLRGRPPRNATAVAMANWVARRAMLNASVVSQTYSGAAAWLGFSLAPVTVFFAVLGR